MAQGDKSLRESLPLASADYSDILEALTDYMREQDELLDYDFEGSTAKTLLRLLAYNTHINALMMNMTHNEAFLSTAVRRDSVVKRARDLGYVPRSTRSSVAKVRVTLVPSAPVSTITIPKYHPFTASDGTNTFTFYTTDAISVVEDINGNFTADIEITEGKVFSHQYTVDSSNIDKFIIPNQLVDTRFVSVQVVELGTSTPIAYAQKDSITELKPTSKVFWVFEGEGSLHEIEFGDGSIGKSLKAGDVVNVNYIISSGSESNGVARFSTSQLIGVDSISITTIESALGGSEIESIESIKYSAPRYFASQNRAVIEEDFEAILRNEYTNLDDINVWGGETNNPPAYGKVFICIKPEVGLYLSSSEKDKIINQILEKKYSVISITPVISDPEYLYALINLEVDYDASLTSNSQIVISEIIKESTLDYFDTYVSKFGEGYRNSIYLRTIDSAERSIVSSNVEMSLQKRHYPPIDYSSHNIEFSFSGKIQDGSFYTSSFRHLSYDDCIIRQNATSANTLDLAFYSETQQKYITLINNVGTIDLETGVISIQDFIISGITSSPANTDEFGNLYVSFNAKPEDKDFISNFNEILLVENKNINVKMTTI